jgi:probable HAF family extracellular repeat protein
VAHPFTHPWTTRRASTVLAAGLLMACEEEVMAPRPQPRDTGPTLSAATSTGFSAAIAQLPWLAAYGAQNPWPQDVNDRGDVVGGTWTFVRADGAWDDSYRATFWPGDGGPPRVLAPLGGVDVPGVIHTEASDINDRGDVVGMRWSEDDNSFRIILWPGDGGPPRELVPVGGSAEFDLMQGFPFPSGNGSLDINDRGDVVGWSLAANGSYRATLWTADGGPPRDLGTLSATYPNSQALEINDFGDVVGTSYAELAAAPRATLWPADRGPPVDLGALGAGLSSYAASISASGYITGYGGSLTAYANLDGAGALGPVGIRWPPVIVSGPRLWQPADVAKSTDVGVCSAATIDLGTPTVFGDAAAVTVSAVRGDNQPLTAPYPKGVTTITWTAVNAENHATTVTQTVTVRDLESPTLLAPDRTLPNDPGLGTAAVEGAATATDNCLDVALTGTRSDGRELTVP